MPQPTAVHGLVSGVTMRLRSSWPSSALSYSGRKRTGAGVSGSGSGAPGTSNSSRPRSSRKLWSRGRRRSSTSRIPASPDHERTSRGRGRAERGQVPQDHLVGFPRRLEPPAQPALHGGERGRPGPAPQAARGDLDQREQVHRGGGELAWVVIRPALGEERHELGPGARAFLQQAGGERHQLGDVEPRQRPSERALAVQGPLHHRLEQRTQRERVPRRDEVERGAEQAHPHRATVDEWLDQPFRAEPIQARPQRDVGVAGHLSLQADQALDGVGDRDPAPPEQHLTFEQGSVQRSTSQHTRPAGCQLICVPSLIQFGRQVTPPSPEKACSHRFVVGETIRHW